jgi:hypothetical protein
MSTCQIFNFNKAIDQEAIHLTQKLWMSGPGLEYFELKRIGRNRGMVIATLPSTEHKLDKNSLNQIFATTFVATPQGLELNRSIQNQTEACRWIKDEADQNLYETLKNYSINQPNSFLLKKEPYSLCTSIVVAETNQTWLKILRTNISEPKHNQLNALTDLDLFFLPEEPLAQFHQAQKLITEFLKPLPYNQLTQMGLNLEFELTDLDNLVAQLEIARLIKL